MSVQQINIYGTGNTIDSIEAELIKELSKLDIGHFVIDSCVCQESDKHQRTSVGHHINLLIFNNKEQNTEKFIFNACLADITEESSYYLETFTDKEDIYAIAENTLMAHICNANGELTAYVAIKSRWTKTMLNLLDQSAIS